MNRSREAGEVQRDRRWVVLGWLSLAELLALSLWMSASALVPTLAARWQLDPGQAGWLTTTVQLGFVVGTALAALLNLADLVPSRHYFSASAVAGAAVNTALLADLSYESALVVRFLTGVAMAGVYPPAMKMVATWFRTERGLAIGILVGALCLGKAVPHLVLALAGRSLVAMVAATSGAALIAALIVLFAYRDGPHRFAKRPFDWRLAGQALAHRPTRLAIAGYLGHMWELYAMWIWIPAFLAASIATWSGAAPVPSHLADLLAFGTIAAGAAGCVWGGLRADRRGRERLVIEAMAMSGALAVAIGFTYGSHPALVGVVALLWGFFVVADSAQFSTLVTEVAPPHAVGTALNLQTSLGFLLTMASIQLVPEIAAREGWRLAFPVLALGPVAGIAAIRRLARVASGT